MNSHHPVYGDFQYNTWMPAYGHRTFKKKKEHEFVKLDNYEIMFIDNIETPFFLRNKITKRTKQIHHEYYTSICNHNKHANYSAIHVALASAFPNIPAKETVDHINDNPNDNRLVNLQWMNRSENSRKGQVKSVKQSNQNGGRRCKYVTMRKPDENDKKNREKSVSIGLFRNVDKCAKFIIDNVVQRDSKPKIKTVAAKIRRAIARPELKAYGYYFDAHEIKIENEEWKSHPKNTQNTIINTNVNVNKVIPEKKTLLNGRQYPNNPLGDLMRRAPRGIQYIHPKNRSTSYVLSRRFTKCGREYKSSGSKKKSDEEKFLQIIQLYKQHCKEEKAVQEYLDVKIEDLKQFIPLQSP